jgi:hypothetical protein
MDFFFDEDIVTKSPRYLNAIKELSKIPEGSLTQEKYASIFGYEMVETYHNIVLKGHWKLRVLWETHHEMYPIRVKWRSK